MKLKMLAVLVVGSLLAAGAGGQDKDKTDEEKLQGTWTFVSLERGGQEVMDDFVKEAKAIIANGKVKLQAQGKEMEVSIKLDPTKKPKHIDITAMDGGKEVLHKGIYELDGDNFKICFGPPGENRPSEFKTQGGSSEQMAVLKREK
jgi:uncharacterized protein (TIGR03067 family)